MRLYLVATYFRQFREAAWRALGKEYSVRTLLSERLDWAHDIASLAPETGTPVAVSIANDKPTQLDWTEANRDAFDLDMMGKLREARASARFDSPGGLSWGPEEHTLAEEIALAQVRVFRPDVVLLTNPYFPSIAWRNKVRRIGALIAVQATQPIPDLGLLDGADLALTVCGRVAARYRAVGRATATFQYGFNPRLLDRISRAPCGEVMFVGQLSASHLQRHAIFAALAASVPFAWYGPASDAREAAPPLQKAWRGEAFGAAMYTALASATVAVNMPPDFAPWLMGMFRTFETLGLGLPLVMPAAVEEGLGLRAGEHYRCFTDASDAVRVCRNLLHEPSEADEMGRRAQAHILAEHSSDRAVARLLATLSGQQAMAAH